MPDELQPTESPPMGTVPSSSVGAEPTIQNVETKIPISRTVPSVPVTVPDLPPAPSSSSHPAVPPLPSTSPVPSIPASSSQQTIIPPIFSPPSTLGSPTPSPSPTASSSVLASPQLPTPPIQPPKIG